ncbi:aldehyde dehydrogenase family protein [Lacisediminihabitans sp. FW035]
MSTSTLAPALSATVNGKAVDQSVRFDVINPATGRVFASAPSLSAAQVDEAFTAAAAAFRNWKRDDGVRTAALLAAADAIDAAAAQLASILTSEQGKPISDAATEVAMTSGWLRYFATLEIPLEVVQDDATGFAEVHRRPLGVVAAITPWNFPLLLAMWKIAPALRTGNTMVLKPSPYTPLTSLALGEILRGVLPDGVFNVVTGLDPLGQLLTSHPLARKISFTGSTATGKKVASAAADDLKRVTLELGGNDPAIVLPGSSVDDIAQSLFWGAFMNNGQVCLAAKRIYVHDSIHDDLVDALAGIAKTVKVDEGNVEGAQLGPLNNLAQYDRVGELVKDAISHGAHVAAGGKAIDRDGYFFEPTILSNVTDGLAIVDQEQFGPALPVISYSDVDDVIERANRGNFGLTASIWSADPAEAATLASQIDAGQVSINVHGSGVRPDLPFGGHKWSGIGVENGPWGLHSFTETQVITGPPRQ